MDDFRCPSAPLRPRADSPEGRYKDSYDYSVFRRVLVDPFRMAGSTGFVTAGFDWEPRRAVRIGVADRAGSMLIMIVDGVFLTARVARHLGLLDLARRGLGGAR